MADGPENKRAGRARINPPGTLDPSDPSYFRQCGFALEPSIEGLIELAVQAGWSRENVVLAMLVASERHLKGLGIYLGREIQLSDDGNGVPCLEQFH